MPQSDSAYNISFSLEAPAVAIGLVLETSDKTVEVDGKATGTPLAAAAPAPTATSRTSAAQRILTLFSSCLFPNLGALVMALL